MKHIFIIADNYINFFQGKVVFYAETTADLSGLPCSLPVVRLHGVANAYPPQKKSFMMLRHMQREFGDSFRLAGFTFSLHRAI